MNTKLKAAAAVIIASTLGIGGYSIYRNSQIHSNNSIAQAPASDEELSVISLDANYIKFDNFLDLSTTADLIVTGKPLENFTERQHYVSYFPNDQNHVQDFYTLSNFKIDKIIKQPPKESLKNGEVIQVGESVSIIDNQ